MNFERRKSWIGVCRCRRVWTGLDFEFQPPAPPRRRGHRQHKSTKPFNRDIVKRQNAITVSSIPTQRQDDEGQGTFAPHHGPLWHSPLRSCFRVGCCVSFEESFGSPSYASSKTTGTNLRLSPVLHKLTRGRHACVCQTQAVLWVAGCCCRSLRATSHSPRVVRRHRSFAHAKPTSCLHD